MTKSASSAARRNGTQAANSSSRPGSMPTFRGRDVVFVDPLDDKESYWWPAMIVPIPEIDPSMDCTVLNPGECLVKYFEDNKYSVVKFTELQLFIPTTIPFLEFESNAGQKFLKSGGVINALAYLESGKVKRKFSWQYWGTAKDDELDLTQDKQKPLRLPLKRHDESSSSSSSASSSSTASNGHGKKGSTPGPSTTISTNTNNTTATSATTPSTTTTSSKDSAHPPSPAAARKRTAKHSASHDLASDADKALSPSRKRFSTPTALDTTATTTDTSSSASTPVTPDQDHVNGGVTAPFFSSEKNSPSKTASTGGATGHHHPRARTSENVASQAQTSTNHPLQSQEHHLLELQLQQQQQQQHTKGGRKRKARTNSTPSSSAATSPSIPTASTLTDEPEEIKTEDNISPASTVGVKRTRSTTATSSTASATYSSQDTSSPPTTLPPPAPPAQSSSAASSPTQPAVKRRRGKVGATSNGGGNARAESVPLSTSSSRAGSRHGSVDLGAHPNAPPSPTVGRTSRSSKQGAASSQHQESDADGSAIESEGDARGQVPSTSTSSQGERGLTETSGADGVSPPTRPLSARSTPEPGSASGKKGRGTKHAAPSNAANGNHHDGPMEGEHDQEFSLSVPSMSSSTSVSSDQAQQEQDAEKLEDEEDARLTRDRRRMKVETDSDASSSTSSSLALSAAMSAAVSSVSMELDAFGLERRDMVHKMQMVLPTLPMGSKEREAMYESCMDHLQKLRKEHLRLRQILQMTGATLDRRHKGGRKTSPSLSVSSGRSYRSSSRQQQNGVTKEYQERSSSPTVNGSRPSRAGTNRFYGRTR
ncbi:hypothetical protein DFQ27_009133 [Actinomortierella ambigua]|uniref:PWWP domain-containing protein n=1 Tax=Actinomortierella ambigua TaxID=1343610 RepID=A0A9P6PR34_9FUNG|nr:hypothetical protein DFQ27_009133 [Actinomortierella ambigua]